MQNVYLITGASSDVGCALIRRLADHDSQALIVAQGAGDLNRLAELCGVSRPIRTYDVDLTDENALNAIMPMCRPAARPHPSGASACAAGDQHQVQEVRRGTV